MTGDPEFDLFRAAYPYSLRRAVKLFGVGGVANLAMEVSGKLREMGMEESVIESYNNNII